MDLRKLILPAWKTNARITEELIRALPLAVYRAAPPKFPRRTVQAMAVHIHNSRCGWLRTLGEPLGVEVPPRLDPAKASRQELVRELKESAYEMGELLALGCDNDGVIPATRRYVWRNLALDVAHVLTYFVGHEAHHRGQLVLAARMMGQPVPKKFRGDLWWWKAKAGRRLGG